MPFPRLGLVIAMLATLPHLSPGSPCLLQIPIWGRVQMEARDYFNGMPILQVDANSFSKDAFVKESAKCRLVAVWVPDLTTEAIGKLDVTLAKLSKKNWIKALVLTENVSQSQLQKTFQLEGVKAMDSFSLFSETPNGQNIHMRSLQVSTVLHAMFPSTMQVFLLAFRIRLPRELDLWSAFVQGPFRRLSLHVRARNQLSVRAVQPAHERLSRADQIWRNGGDLDLYTVATLIIIHQGRAFDVITEHLGFARATVGPPQTPGLWGGELTPGNKITKFVQ